MSPVTLFTRGEEEVQMPEPAVPFTFPDAPRIKLRRTGQRPLVFEGAEICSATTHAPGPSLWYEINLYRKKNAQLVVDIRFFSKIEAMKDKFTAFVADNLEEVAHILETYDPAGDVTADMPLDDESVPTARIAIQAAAVRLRIDEARRQFADLVGEILHQLDVH